MTTPSTTVDDISADERLHRALRSNANDLASVERKRDQLLTDRLALYRAATERGWTQARIAAAARTQEGAVTQVLRRARQSNR